MNTTNTIGGPGACRVCGTETGNVAFHESTCQATLEQGPTQQAVPEPSAATTNELPKRPQLVDARAEAARLRDDYKKAVTSLEIVVLALFGENQTAPTDAKSLAETIIGLKAEAARLQEQLDNRTLQTAYDATKKLEEAEAEAARLREQLADARTALTKIHEDWKDASIEADTLRQHHANAEAEAARLREAFQQVRTLAHGSGDKVVCLITITAIQRIATEALAAVKEGK